ncbi:MAG: patatin-like phospholipase family protein [Alphaproteobacteria bacterium]
MADPSLSATFNPMAHLTDYSLTSTSTRGRPRIALALQGGGAHGAFTWGVLDRLMEVPHFDLTALSGASAGAINAAVLLSGILRNGPQGGRERLTALWQRVGRMGRYSPLRASLLERFTHGWNSNWAGGHLAFDLLTRFFSPYQFNPFDLNPLRIVLSETVDIDALHAEQTPALFISATDLHNGSAQIFTGKDITLDTLMASACIPFLHQAVSINGRYYWDGGYSSNPPLLALAESGFADDIVLVQIHAGYEPSLPTEARGIHDRLNQIMLNAPLAGELKSFDLYNRLRQAQEKSPLRLHRIAAEKELRPLGSSSKLNAEPGFLDHLFSIGRDAAARWLETDGAQIGLRSTYDPLDDTDGEAIETPQKSLRKTKSIRRRA